MAAHANALFRYAIARVRDRAAAEDLVQETFLAALRNEKSFAGQSSERTWLTAILRHRIADWYRKRAPATELTTDAQDEIRGFFSPLGHWRSGPASWKSPDADLNREEFWRVMEGCLGGLPESMAAAMQMREIAGMESDEICEALGISQTNLWTLLHRARLRLRTCLERNWFGKAR